MSEKPSPKLAHSFALVNHDGQKRKHTGEPYIVHPEAVVSLLELTNLESNDAVIAAAYLHDVIEDCGVMAQEIAAKFGSEVAYMVDQLSDLLKPEDGNREYRKRVQADRLANSHAFVQSIKYADILDNWKSIKIYDPSFAKVYRRECQHLCEVMTKGHELLRRLAIMELQS